MLRAVWLIIGCVIQVNKSILDTMEVKTKLRFCLVFSAIALVLKIIVFISPGWVVVKSYFRDPLPTHVVQKSEHVIDRRHGISISFGVWFYKVCRHERNNDEGDEGKSEFMEEKTTPKDTRRTSEGRHHHHERHPHRCYHRSYKKQQHGQRIDYVGEDIEQAQKNDKTFENNIPTDFIEAREFINTSVEFARHGRYELTCYVTIGLILGLIGMAGAIKYARGGGVGKHTGRLVCSTQVFSSFFYWVAIIRVATFVIQLRTIQKHEILDDHMGHDVWFSVPWCLIVGAIGAIVMDISALFHLIMISRDRKSDGVEYSFHTEKHGSSKVPIIAPRGYEQLMIPPLYIQEEAGPLPEKEPIS